MPMVVSFITRLLGPQICEESKSRRVRDSVTSTSAAVWTLNAARRLAVRNPRLLAVAAIAFHEWPLLTPFSDTLNPHLLSTSVRHVLPSFLSRSPLPAYQCLSYVCTTPIILLATILTDLLQFHRILLHPDVPAQPAMRLLLDPAPHPIRLLVLLV